MAALKQRKLCYVIGVGIIHDNDRYLLCQRNATGVFPLLWEFPGGKQEQNETIQETIIRELHEELHVHVSIGHKLGDYDWSYPEFSVRLICYFVTVKEPSSLRLNVHAAASWCSLQEIVKYKLLPSNVQLVQAIEKFRALNVNKNCVD